MRLINLDMDALRSFVVGTEAGSFARAAERLGRSTSAISAQLKKLEDQTGVVLTRKVGRNLDLTDSGEALLSYARRLLELNDEAVDAVRGSELDGWIRIGLQEDFGETVLPTLLGRFCRAHPRVRIEGRIARNHELIEKIAAGQLDLALVWDNGHVRGHREKLADIPLCWLGPSQNAPLWSMNDDTALPLIAFEQPCILRQLACEQLDQSGQSWRIAFSTPSLAGLWAATAAGLGVALRTSIGLPASVQRLEIDGLPQLPSLGLSLISARQDQGPVGTFLASLIRQTIQDVVIGPEKSER